MTFLGQIYQLFDENCLEKHTKLGYFIRKHIYSTFVSRGQLNWFFQESCESSKIIDLKFIILAMMKKHIVPFTNK